MINPTILFVGGIFTLILGSILRGRELTASGMVLIWIGLAALLK